MHEEQVRLAPAAPAGRLVATRSLALPNPSTEARAVRLWDSTLAAAHRATRHAQTCYRAGRTWAESGRWRRVAGPRATSSTWVT